MRVLLDATCIVDQPTGAGFYAYNIIRSLVHVESSDDYVILVQKKLSRSHPLFQLEVAGKVKIFSQPIPVIGFSRDILLSFYLWRTGGQYDVFVSFMPYLPFFYSHPNSIITIHDLGYLKFPNFFKKPWHKIYFKFILKHSFAKASKIITVSNSTKDDLIEKFLVKNEKISVVYGDSALKFDDINSGESSVGQPFFLYVGERRPHKNLENLIRAFRIFKNNDVNNYFLKLVGKDYGGYTAKLKKVVEELNLQNSVIFIDQVADADLKFLYEQSFALILVSFYEGFGLPLVEAMKCGKAIIASNVYSLPEIAGNAALYVDPNNLDDLVAKMNMLVVDTALREQLSKNGRIRGENFSWDKSAFLLSQIIRKK